ncbi:MAG: reverse transcriptase domain-containing protein [Clostridium sp.]
MLNNWTTDRSNKVIDLLISDRYKDAISEKRTLDTKLDALCEHVFSPQDYHMYRNLITTASRQKFLTVSNFINHLQDLKTRADLCCKNKEDKVPERDIFDKVISTLTHREKEMLIFNKATTLAEVKEILDQASSMESLYQFTSNSPHHTRKSTPATTSEKYCSYHKSNFHNTSECRAKNDLTRKPSRNGKNLIIKPQRINQHISCTAEIQNQRYDFIVDTGAEENYISDEIASTIISKTIPIRKTIELANGDRTTITKKLLLNFGIKGQNKLFSEEFHVLPSLPYSGVLGLNFLKKHQFQIDCANRKIFVTQSDKTVHSTPDQQLEIKSDLIYPPSSKLQSFLRDFKRNNPTLGHIKTHEMTIPLVSSIPVHKKPYPVPIALLPKVHEEINRLLKLGVIRKNASTYSSPAFPIKKKNGDIRLVVDYRELNSKTVKLGYPFPNIQYSMINLKGAIFFSQLDLNMGYYQIPIKKEETHKTSFVLPFGQYEFLRMPFGLCNAPREFQKVMTDMFQDMPFVKVFVDDILIFSKTYFDHEEHIMKVLKRCKENDVSVNFDKSSFVKTEVKYLGKIINKDGIRADPSAAVTLENFGVPKTKKQIMRILGIINWFREHIPDLSRKIITLTNKLKENVKFSWTNEDTKCLENITHEIKNNALLHHPDIAEPFTLLTDASDEGLGAVLEQKGRIIGLYSKKLYQAEKNYTTTEKELLAVVKALQHFRPIVLGAKITVRTDHNNLTYITQCLTNRAQRWKILLDEFGVQLSYIKGEENIGADLLSRCLLTSARTENLNSNYVTDIIYKDYQPNSQRKHIQGVPISETIPKNFHGTSVLTDQRNRIIVPETNERAFLSHIHGLLAHPGLHRFYNTIKDAFYIHNLFRKVSKISTHCEVCQKNKQTSAKHGKLRGFITADKPFEKIAIDLLGPFERSVDTEPRIPFKLHLLVIIDIFSKWIRIIPLKQITSRKVIGAIKTKWIQEYGVPKSLLSDQGRQFTSDEFRAFLKRYNVCHETSSAYNPTGNSVVERANQVIGNGLRCLHNLPILKSLKLIENAMCNSYHSTLGTTPYQLIYEKHPMNPFVQGKINYHQIRRRKKELAEKDLELRNRFRRNKLYRLKQLVLIRSPMGGKLDARWEGPFTILKTSNKRNFVIVRCGKKNMRVNIKRIKPFKRGRHVV